MLENIGLDYLSKDEIHQLISLGIKIKDLTEKNEAALSIICSDKASGEEKTKKLIESEDLREEISNVQNDFIEIIKAAPMRYIEDTATNKERLFEDINSCLDKVTKADYKEWREAKEKDLEETTRFLSAFKDKTGDLTKHAETLKKEVVRGYNSFVLFLLELCRIQFVAFDYKNIPNDEAIKLIEEKAAQFYKPPKEKLQQAKIKKTNLDTTIPANYKLFPYGGGSDALRSAIIADGNIERLAYREKFDKHYSIDTFSKGDTATVTIKRNNNVSSVQYTTDDVIAAISGGRKLKINLKLLYYILSLIPEQARGNNNVVQYCITGSYKDLSENGIYENERTARQEYIKNIEPLRHLSVSGVIEIGKGITEIQDAYAPLFKLVTKGKGTFNLVLNDVLNWNFVTPFFAPIPVWAFRLNTKAFTLFTHIIGAIRRQSAEIRDNGYIYISISNIYSNMSLPPYETARNPQRDIKDVIENSIDNIEDIQNTYGNTTPPEFQFELERDYSAPIEKYLTEGKLKVIVNGEMRNMLSQISEKKSQKILQLESTNKKVKKQ